MPMHEFKSHPADQVADVRNFSTLILAVSGMPSGGVVTLYAASRVAGTYQAVASVRLGDLSPVPTITADGMYELDGAAGFKWSLTTPGTGPAPVVDVIAKG